MTERDSYIGDELSLFSRAHNWKRYWSARLRPLIQAPVLEVGAGIGSNLALLRQANEEWTALEPDIEQANNIRATFATSKTEPNSLTVQTGTLDTIDRQQRFKTILYIDVLEHIEHDRDEVARAFSHLEDGGRLIVLAPAHQRLYSPFDKAVGHFRRYNKLSLTRLTPQDSNAQISALYYLDSVGCIASLANSVLLKSSMPSSRQIWLWDSLMVPVSRFLDKLLAHRLGKTVVIVWTRQRQITA